MFFTPLLCSWYREGSAIPLQAPVNRGGSKDRQTTSTLSITPQREDDGAKYRCVVWNRAMPEGQPLETIVTLNVNCKSNFVNYTLYFLLSIVHIESVCAHYSIHGKLICNFDSINLKVIVILFAETIAMR